MRMPGGTERIIERASSTGEPGFRIFMPAKVRPIGSRAWNPPARSQRLPATPARAPGAWQAALRRRHFRNHAAAGDPPDARRAFYEGLLYRAGNRGAYPLARAREPFARQAGSRRRSAAATRNQGHRRRNRGRRDYLRRLARPRSTNWLRWPICARSMPKTGRSCRRADGLPSSFSCPCLPPPLPLVSR